MARRSSIGIAVALGAAFLLWVLIRSTSSLRPQRQGRPARGFRALHVASRGERQHLPGMEIPHQAALWTSPENARTLVR